jgi:transcriptional regulator with GAF, ATPase, and Fis domain
LSDNIAEGISRGGEVLALMDNNPKNFILYFDKRQHFLSELRLPFFFNNRSIGVLSLGKKESGMDYTIEEIDLFRLMVNFIAIKCGQLIHSKDNNSLSANRLSNENISPTRLEPKIKIRRQWDETGLLGNSPRMEYINELIEKIAKENVSILITGESGTGKELIARAIHKKSNRSLKQLVAMNCAALADNLVESELFGHEKGAFTGAYSQKKGKFEFANDSTLFLDEIGDMSLQTQAKLLRVLQDGTYQRVGGNKTLHSDARLLAATNKNLLQQIENGGFREDLFYRINVVQIEMPPLRKRGDDIVLLADHFFQFYNNYYKKNLLGIGSSVYQWLLNYNFPGNIRELRNIIERAVIMEHGNKISIHHMPTHSDSPQQQSQDVSPRLSLEELEKEHIRSVLEKTDNNKSAAARLLGIARKTLREKILKYNL